MAVRTKLSQTQPQPTPSLAFNNRTVLYVFEVAAKLRVSERHVFDLIDEGKLQALNLAGNKNATDRRCIRVPVEAYEAYIQGAQI